MADQEELIWAAVADAVEPIASLESQLDSEKLQKKIRECFRKGAKGLEFRGKSWEQAVDDYADGAFGTLFSSLGDREWLLQADFLLVFDAGVKDNFPPNVIAHVPQDLFEQVVLKAHDRALEEQRVSPMIWEETKDLGGKTTKKVRNALDEAHKEALRAHSISTAGPADLESFCGMWIDISLRNLTQACGGWLDGCMPQDDTLKLFHTLVDGGALPPPMVEAHGAPPAGWSFVDDAVGQAYLAHNGTETAAVAAPVAMSGAGGGAGCAGGWGNGVFGKGGCIPGKFGMKGGCKGCGKFKGKGCMMGMGGCGMGIGMGGCGSDDGFDAGGGAGPYGCSAGKGMKGMKGMKGCFAWGA